MRERQRQRQTETGTERHRERQRQTEKERETERAIWRSICAIVFYLVLLKAVKFLLFVFPSGLIISVAPWQSAHSSRSEGRWFEPRQERRENFLLQS